MDNVFKDTPNKEKTIQINTKGQAVLGSRCGHKRCHNQLKGPHQCHFLMHAISSIPRPRCISSYWPMLSTAVYWVLK